MKPRHNDRVALDGTGGVRFVDDDQPAAAATVPDSAEDDYSGILDGLPSPPAQEPRQRARGDLDGLVVPAWPPRPRRAAKRRSGGILPPRWDDRAFLHYPEPVASVDFVPAAARTLWDQLTPEQRAEWRAEQPDAAAEAERETAPVPGVPPSDPTAGSTNGPVDEQGVVPARERILVVPGASGRGSR